jgi:hypothetical protein
LGKFGNVVTVQIGCGVNPKLNRCVATEIAQFDIQQHTLLLGEDVGVVNHERLHRRAPKNIIVGK